MNVCRIASIAVLIVLLNGCQAAPGTYPEDRKAAIEDAPVSDVKSVPFDLFALKVNYGDGKHNTFEARYQKKEHEEAEIKDKLNDADREGEEALNEMKMVLSELPVSKSEKESAVICNVLEAFNLDKGYDRFQLRVTWPDGTSKVYIGKS